MNYKTYVVQMRVHDSHVWHDYIHHSDQKAIEEIVKTLRTAETKLPVEHRRAFRVVLRRTVDEVLLEGCSS